MPVEDQRRCARDRQSRARIKHARPLVRTDQRPRGPRCSLMTSLHRGIGLDAPGATLVSNSSEIALLEHRLACCPSCDANLIVTRAHVSPIKVSQCSLYSSLPSRIFSHPYLSEPFRPFLPFESRMRLALAHYTRYEIHASLRGP